jgi:hypothetical protein
MSRWHPIKGRGSWRLTFAESHASSDAAEKPEPNKEIKFLKEPANCRKAELCLLVLLLSSTSIVSKEILPCVLNLTCKKIDRGLHHGGGGGDDDDDADQSRGGGHVCVYDIQVNHCYLVRICTCNDMAALRDEEWLLLGIGFPIGNGILLVRGFGETGGNC